MVLQTHVLLFLQEYAVKENVCQVVNIGHAPNKMLNIIAEK